MWRNIALQVLLWSLLDVALVKHICTSKDDLRKDEDKDQEAHSRAVGCYDYSSDVSAGMLPMI